MVSRDSKIYMLDIAAVYQKLCPQCGKDLSTDESKRGLCYTLKRNLCLLDVDNLFSEFSNFFKKALGELTSIQKFWAKRVLSGESFAAVAPTGVGKTTFGLAMSAFLATKGKRCYAIFPTSVLAEQSYDRLIDLCNKLNIKIKILYYRSKMKKSEKEKFFENLGKEDILITTSQFLSKNFSKIRCCYDFIFVDDVDSILKASKNVERILALLGIKLNENDKKCKTVRKTGVLMISTATAKKGSKIKYFRKYLNFDVGLSHHTLMNIENIILNEENIETIKKILKIMGKGGIIYTRSVEEAEKIAENLSEFKIGLVTGNNKIKNYEMFEKGEIDYLIGTSHYYGSLVRGLDLPEKIRFAIFIGAPVFRIKIEDIDNISERMYNVLTYILKIDEKNINKGKEKIKEILKTGININVKDVCIKKGEIIFPDVRTYIQGSGRTSRLFAGGITKGAVFLLEKDECILNAFIERAKYYNIEFKKIKEVNFEKLIEEIDKSRREFGKKEVVDIIKPALFIVESPTKAKQISRFFGKPSVKILDVVSYEVPSIENILLITASLGHVTDLTTNRGFHGVEIDKEINKSKKLFTPIYSPIKKCINCGYQFTSDSETCPKCGGEIDSSKRRIDALRKLAHDTGIIIIGTDPDSEGEKIAWDLSNLLSGCGKIKRAEFHEVTPKAVIKALKNLREINSNLVKSQIVRRVEDRWIGFVLSQKLWDVFNSKNLSAGRAQTPVLGWIIERYKEHKIKKGIVYLDVGISIENELAEKIIDILKNKETKETNSDIKNDKNLNNINKDKYKIKIKIEMIEKKMEEKQPLPPYTTDSMLRDANTILKLSANETMKLAQDLFESGLITYHRTDSTRVSETGLNIAKEWLGNDFYAREWFKEGAHECIRPTRSADRDTIARLINEGVIFAENITWKHLSLYDLIFRRFMASQCKNYTVEIAKYRIYIGNIKNIEITEERIINAVGKAYELYKPFKLKKELPLGEIITTAIVKFVPLKPLLTQSDVIMMMKDRGIGRPSTYSTIIDKLFKRNYIIEKSGRLIPTRRGIKVYEYLMKNYSEFVNEERTKKLEEKMDAVEKGDIDYMDVLAELYEEIAGI